MKRFFLVIILNFFFLCALGAVETDNAPKSRYSIHLFDKEFYDRPLILLQDDRHKGVTFQFTPGLDIITLPESDAKVYIADEEKGLTPYSRSDLSPNVYRIRVEKTGYSPVEFFAKIEPDRRTVITIQLEPLTSRIQIQGLPDSIQLFVDGEPKMIQGNELAVHSGKHRIRLVVPGFQDYTEYVNLSSEQVYLLNPVLVPEPFNWTILAPINSCINPESGWKIRVPEFRDGHLTLILRDSQGTERARYELEPGSARVQDIIPDGEPLPALYQLNYRYQNGDILFQGNISLTISERFHPMSRGSVGGVPGLLYCPLAETLPPDFSETGTAFLVHTYTSGNEILFPVMIYYRNSPVEQFEWGLSMTEVTGSTEDLSFFYGTFFGKYQLIQGENPFDVSALVKVIYAGQLANPQVIPVDLPLSWSRNVSISLPSSYRAGFFQFLLAPGWSGVFSSAPGEEDDDRIFTGFYSLLEIRAGILADITPVTLGLSYALKSNPVPGALQFENHYLGMEASLNIPGTPFRINALCGLEFKKELTAVTAGIDFRLLF